MPKVSVIIPIYNAGQKLNKCIKSILNQSFRDFELILVNDGSKDNSLSICQKFQGKDNRIVIVNKSNEGSIATRRKGVEVSKAGYVLFVDADDWIDKDMIEILYRKTKEYDTDITVCNMYKVVGSGRLIKKESENRYFKNDVIYHDKQIKEELVVAYLHGHTFPSSLCAKLYKKELLLSSGNFLNRIRFLGDDLFYNLEIFLKAKKVKVIDKPLYYYRLGGFTSKYMPHLFDDMVNGYSIQKEVLEEHYQDNKQNNYYGISLMLLNTFRTCLKNLFNSDLSEIEIEHEIKRFVSNEAVIECLTNDGSIKNFPKEYLEAIKNQDIVYLYKLGENDYKKARPRILLKKILSAVC